MNQLVIDTTLERVRAALEAGKVEDALAVLANLHPADRAEAFSDLPRDDQEELLPRLDPEDAAELLEELEDEEAAEAAASLPTAALADVLDEMEPDAAADILGDLPPAQASAALAEMDAEQAEDVRPLLAHADDTAGGLMTPEFFALRRQMTVRQAIDFLRGQDFDHETPYYLYVVDRNDRLIGVVGLRDLIQAAPDTLIEAVMNHEVRSVPVGADQEEVARLMKKYGWLAVPVVDADGRLVGVIRHDDIVHVLEEEATEDLYRLSNVSDGDLTPWSPVRVSVSRRLPWLYVNLFTAFLAAAVVSLFEATIAKVAILAVFQGIVAGQGGNAGTQTLAIMVRGIALGEIELRDAGPMIFKEVGIGLALAGNMVAAGLAGTLVPLTLKAFRLDPALASAVLVTAVTDCVGFGLFLGLATLFLPYLAV